MIHLPVQRFTLFLLLTLCLAIQLTAQEVYPIGLGWARTKVNAPIFRRNALCSHGQRQVVAYYDAQSRVIVAERTLDSDQWQIHVTPFTGRTIDAHNSISLAFDGEGYLHMAWDHHGGRLRYAKTRSPDRIEFAEPTSMVGQLEERVTYPEFYLVPGGDLLFFYRHGASGNGNLVLNRYQTATGQWTRIQDNLLDGQGERNAYWQVAVDGSGHVHLSWVWRETGDVVTNHDIAYAVSRDGGISWRKTTGEPYSIPIDQSSAEYAVRIPQNSELANQTSMAVDAQGHPCIVNFWRVSPEAVPQYWLIRHDGLQWTQHQIGTRTLNFYRRGGGTKRPPISRPLLLLDPSGATTKAVVLFRDLERGEQMHAAQCSDLTAPTWTFHSVTRQAIGQSDPLVDPIAWAARREIHLLTQRVGQGDGEKQEDVPPQMVSVTVWKP